MSTPRERLEETRKQARSAGGHDAAQMAAQTQASIDCAVEITEALMGLTTAVQSLETNSVKVMSNMIGRIDTATEQVVISSTESTKVAKESTKLSGQLNFLTKWIIAAAILSAIAAAIQAATALYAILK
jgi:hypothetical protein